MQLAGDFPHFTTEQAFSPGPALSTGDPRLLFPVNAALNDWTIASIASVVSLSILRRFV